MNLVVEYYFSSTNKQTNKLVRQHSFDLIFQTNSIEIDYQKKKEKEKEMKLGF